MIFRSPIMTVFRISYKKCSKVFFLSLFTVCLSLSPFYVKLEQQMAKMNDRVLIFRFSGDVSLHVRLHVQLQFQFCCRSGRKVHKNQTA